MPNAYRTGAYIKIADSGKHAELRVVIANVEAQGTVDVNILEGFIKLFTAAVADMKKLQTSELAPPTKPYQFFVAAEGRK